MEDQIKNWVSVIPDWLLPLPEAAGAAREAPATGVLPLKTGSNQFS